MSDKDYEIGRKQAFVGVLRHCCISLGYDDLEVKRRSWILERENAVIALRDICKEHGDNDWPDSLHLADIINKHLHRNMGYK